MNSNQLRIKENSWQAKIAAKKLGADDVALVLGKTIHLHNTTRETFLKNEKWVKHEICHLQQFEQHGYFGFILKYLWEYFRNGYYNNKFEIEARKAEET